MNKKLMVLLFVSLFDTHLFAAEGGPERTRKRSASPSFEQQGDRRFLTGDRDPLMPSSMDSSDQSDEQMEVWEAEDFEAELVSFESLRIILSYREEDLSEEERRLPSLTNNKNLRLFYKLSSPTSSDSLRCLQRLFESKKLDINEYFLSDTQDKELPLSRGIDNVPLTKMLLKLGADPYKPFEYYSCHGTASLVIEWITPFSMACLENNNDIVKLYALRKYNFNFVDRDNLTPLHYLIAGASIELLAYILVSNRINIAFAKEVLDLEKWIDDKIFLNDNPQLYKDLIVVTEKQENRTFEKGDIVKYREAYDLLEEQMKFFAQDEIKQKIGSIPVFLKDRARGIKPFLIRKRVVNAQIEEA